MQATEILVDNYDHKSQNEQTQTNLKNALDWEHSFVKFMHNYQKENNVSHLFDLAFNSERSIEDELGYIHDCYKFHAYIFLTWSNNQFWKSESRIIFLL